MLRSLLTAGTLGLILTGAPVAVAAPAPTAPTAPTASPASSAQAPRVLAISVDALSPAAIRKVGRAGAPNLFRLIRQGAGTLNARSTYEQTNTLPNHVSMVTGRRVNARRGGHGVDFNDDRPGTVQSAAGGPVSSVFNQVAEAGGSSAVFSTKTKFSILKRSWPRAVDRLVVKEERDRSLMKAARADLIKKGRDFTFVHFGKIDQVGHHRGFQSRPDLRAVRQVDTLIGKLLKAIDNHADLADTVVILTADHGGLGKGHSDSKRLANYRIPFLVWGPGIERANLYKLNASYRNPGRRRVSYAGKQPVRNGDLANLTADLLGLAPVPGSQFDVRQRLRVN